MILMRNGPAVADDRDHYRDFTIFHSPSLLSVARIIPENAIQNLI